MIEFTRPHRGYGSGEKATFSPAMEKELLDAGVARKPEQPVTKESKPADSKTK